MNYNSRQSTQPSTAFGKRKHAFAEILKTYHAFSNFFDLENDCTNILDHAFLAKIDFLKYLSL